MNEKHTILKQVCAAVLLTGRLTRTITDIVVVTIFLPDTYPCGTENFLVCSLYGEEIQIDDVYWYRGRCVVVPQQELLRVQEREIIERLTTPI